MKTPLRAAIPLPFVAMAMLLIGCTAEGPVAPDLAPQLQTPTPAPSAAKGGPVILHVPADHPGAPFYANFDATFIPADDGTVGIVFLRDPDCIPAGFDLLLGFDVPGAFGCDLTVEGKLWFHDPATDPFPYQTRSWGTDVPVYFVDRTELDAAAAGGLTIGELEALPSLLIGYADQYREVIQNSNQGARNGHSVLNAHGTLDDGRPFRLHYNESFDPDTGVRTFLTVSIEIG